MNSRKCEVCTIDVHRASYIKHLRSNKHIENMKKNEMIKPEWLFQEPVENKINKIYNPRSLRKLARDNIRLDDIQINGDLCKRMLDPYYFTDRALRVGFKNNLYNHHINHANSKITIIPNYSEFGIDFRYINKIMKELSMYYARFKNQYILKYQIKQYFQQDLINKMKIINCWTKQKYLLI